MWRNGGREIGRTCRKRPSPPPASTSANLGFQTLVPKRLISLPSIQSPETKPHFLQIHNHIHISTTIYSLHIHLHLLPPPPLSPRASPRLANLIVNIYREGRGSRVDNRESRISTLFISIRYPFYPYPLPLPTSIIHHHRHPYSLVTNQAKAILIPVPHRFTPMPYLSATDPLSLSLSLPSPPPQNTSSLFSPFSFFSPFASPPIPPPPFLASPPSLAQQQRQLTRPIWAKCPIPLLSVVRFLISSVFVPFLLDHFCAPKQQARCWKGQLYPFCPGGFCCVYHRH